jgi:hypothetical protein
MCDDVMRDASSRSFSSAHSSCTRKLIWAPLLLSQQSDHLRILRWSGGTSSIFKNLEPIWRHTTPIVPVPHPVCSVQGSHDSCIEWSRHCSLLGTLVRSVIIDEHTRQDRRPYLFSLSLSLSLVTSFVALALVTIAFAPHFTVFVVF